MICGQSELSVSGVCAASSVFLEMPDNEPSEQQQTQQSAVNGIFPIFNWRHMSPGSIMRKLSAAPGVASWGFVYSSNFTSAVSLRPVMALLMTPHPHPAALLALLVPDCVRGTSHP